MLVRQDDAAFISYVLSDFLNSLDVLALKHVVFCRIEVDQGLLRHADLT